MRRFMGTLQKSFQITTRLPLATAAPVLCLSILMTSCGSAGSQSNFHTPPPGFVLSSSPANVILQQGATGSAAIVITRTGGFTGSVNLSVSGVPAGVMTQINPATTASQSTLSFAISNSAATGTSQITLTGTSSSVEVAVPVNLTLLAAPPPGSLPTTFFVLNNVDPTDDPTADGMFYGAVGHPIRLAWPYIETSRGVYDFSFYDQYVAIAPKRGSGTSTVALMNLTLGMTPGWAVADQSTCRSLNGNVTGCQAPPDNLQDWKDFITALVGHYNGVNAPHIQYYEIWNEWNSNDATNGFWNGPVSSLVNMQASACTIIHSSDSFSLVVTPSTVGTAATPNDQAAAALASYFAANGTSCPGSSNNLIDAVSFHGNVGIMSLSPYPLPGEACSQSGCNGTIVQIANSYREVMNLAGLQNTPLLDTEGGFESANITDNDQRTAWLAQFYALQAGLFNTDHVQSVSWFTWGAPGVAGNIETAGRAPDDAGVAYNQLFHWLVGRLPAACTQSNTVWTCPLAGSSGYQAEIVWDDSQTCTSGICTTSAQSVPGWAVSVHDLTGASTAISGSTAPVGLKPILVENQ